jgi:acetolactate synthase-1/2/3 large subunit
VSSSSKYTGADLISDFIAENCCGSAYLVTGGACAFIVDAIGRNPKTSYVCFQHEQSAAMAADAVWRTTGKVGVTISTSGPGATNLITGIACSWFDSIPALHITGQVNQSESRETIGAAVRQAGFQETDIVSMVTPITKFAKKIESIEDLVNTLPKALGIALEGRMGPVLLDIPMNIQKAEITSAQRVLALSHPKIVPIDFGYLNISELLRNAQRPLVLIGAGAALSGVAPEIQNWCEKYEIPYVASWGAMAYLDRSAKNFFGSIGVYGARGANWLVQACDELLVLGSRLDNRQRTGNPNGFAPFANICVLDIDKEELNKYKTQSNYRVHQFDLRKVSALLAPTKAHKEWASFARESTNQMEDGFGNAVQKGLFNPYYAVRQAQDKFDANAIVVSDCGANLCWVYQSYRPDDSFLFTAGGNSPMGYSLPAAIGAQLSNPERQVYCFIGDGGLQMNLQELQTIVHYQLPIKIFIQNNLGYGIIKQFQDAYFEGRHFATGQGYSVPDFARIAEAFGIPYQAVTNANELKQIELPDGFCIIDMLLPPESLITPKTEMNRFIHDQFPYIADESISKLPYDYPEFPSLLRDTR